MAIGFRLFCLFSSLPPLLLLSGSPSLFICRGSFSLIPLSALRVSSVPVSTWRRKWFGALDFLIFAI